MLFRLYTLPCLATCKYRSVGLSLSVSSDTERICVHILSPPLPYVPSQVISITYDVITILSVLITQLLAHSNHPPNSLRFASRLHLPATTSVSTGRLRPPPTLPSKEGGRLKCNCHLSLWKFCSCWPRAGNATLNRALLQEADGEAGFLSTVCSSKCSVLGIFFPANLEPETTRAELVFIVLPKMCSRRSLRLTGLPYACMWLKA